jgi:putative endonuclease
MMSNKNNKVLYIGITNDLLRRIYEHKNNLIDGFTKKFNCHMLVWFEQINDVSSAILKEKQMKKWKRENKENVINAMNPEWKDFGENFK